MSELAIGIALSIPGDNHEIQSGDLALGVETHQQTRGAEETSLTTKNFWSSIVRSLTISARKGGAPQAWSFMYCAIPLTAVSERAYLHLGREDTSEAGYVVAD
jgi:hypothetical protein